MIRCAVSIWIVASSSGVFAQLNENCTVSVLNRTTRVRPDGSWLINNVPATFGGVRARARATCVQNGITQSGQSSFVNIVADIANAFDADHYCPVKSRIESAG